MYEIGRITSDISINKVTKVNVVFSLRIKVLFNQHVFVILHTQIGNKQILISIKKFNGQTAKRPRSTILTPKCNKKKNFFGSISRSKNTTTAHYNTHEHICTQVVKRHRSHTREGQILFVRLVYGMKVVFLYAESAFRAISLYFFFVYLIYLINT